MLTSPFKHSCAEHHAQPWSATTTDREFVLAQAPGKLLSLSTGTEDLPLRELTRNGGRFRALHKHISNKQKIATGTKEQY